MITGFYICFTGIFPCCYTYFILNFVCFCPYFVGNFPHCCTYFTDIFPNSLMLQWLQIRYKNFFFILYLISSQFTVYFFLFYDYLAVILEYEEFLFYGLISNHPEMHENYLKKNINFFSFQTLQVRKKYMELFKLRAGKFHFPKYKKFSQSGIFLFYKLRKFPPKTFYS